MGNRRKARECALQVLYDLEFNPLPADGGERTGQVARDLDQVLADFWVCFPEPGSVDDEIQAFAARLVRGVCEQRDLIDGIVQKASTNWKLERMALVDRNILRLATYELRFVADIPPKVTLNEAIEIAKRYGSEESSAFINGILDKIAATHP